MTEKRIRSLSCWRGSLSMQPLEGGITNLNYLVRDKDDSFVVRLCEDKSHLGIDRRNERICQEAASKAGVSPEVVHYENGILVSRFLNAKSLSNEDLRNPGLLAKLASVLHRLHDTRNTMVGVMQYFCPFQTVRTYTATAQRLGASIPEDIDDLIEDAKWLSHEMSPFHPTLCHNDLLASNVMDDGEKLWLIDWEYAAIGNPLFDLAGVCANCDLSEDLQLVLLESYLGSIDEKTHREFQILKTISLLREALWSLIQTVASDIDFDYQLYASQNFEAYKNARSNLA